MNYCRLFKNTYPDIMSYQVRPLPLDGLPNMALEFPLYSQPDFLSAFAEAYHVEVYYLGVFKEDDCIACMPVFIRNRLGLHSVISPQLYYYHFISFKFQKSMHLNRIQQRKIDILEALSLYMQKHYQKVSFNLNPSIRDIRGFTWTRMKAIPLYTFIAPLKTISKSDFYVNERNSIHKAEREGVHIEEGANIPEFMRLMKLTNQRQNRLLALTEERHVKLLEDLFSSGDLRQFNAMIENKIIATFLILTDKISDTVYAWQHYTDPEYFNTGVSPFFFHSLFQLLKNDFSSFDFCGANHPAISRYKAAFGANLEIFFRIQGNVLNWK
jgi:hypothetical protein